MNGPVSPLLSVMRLSVRFGGVAALNDVHLDVGKGEIVGLIGPNGAGKTTFFNSVTGVVRPSSGSVRFDDQAIHGWPIERICRAGLVRTFQHTSLFDELTVLENLRVALTARQAGSRRGSELRARETQIATELLSDLDLSALRDVPARELAHGHRKLVAIAIAMAASPKCLLLDEPVAGMNEQEVQRCLSLIRTLRGRGLGILLVEHNVPAVMAVTDRVVVLNFGSVIASGSPTQVQADAAVREAYLGTDVVDA
jgi:branched-chain amino acid transport system ATP-binding protein